MSHVAPNIESLPTPGLYVYKCLRQGFGLAVYSEEDKPVKPQIVCLVQYATFIQLFLSPITQG